MVDERRHQRMSARPPIHVGGTPGTWKSAFALYFLNRLLIQYRENAFVYCHGEVNPGCFLFFKARSWYHPSIVQAFSDCLLLKLLTYDFHKPIWTVLDRAAGIPTRTPVASPG